MKTTISNDKGVVIEANNNGFFFDGHWDDLYAEIHESTGPTALTYEQYRDTGFFMHFFKYNQNDTIFMTYQLSHQWNPTTEVRPHMHFIPMASGSGDAKFDYVYSWVNISGTLPAGNDWTSGSMTYSLTADDQYKHLIARFGSILPPVGAKESVILVFKVVRPGATDAADTYHTTKDHETGAANAGILFFDLHYQKVKPGTLAEYS